MRALLLVIFSISLFFIDIEDNNNSVKHTIVVNHPGFSETDSRDFVIDEIQDSLGNTVEFILVVRSTICLDGYCKVVPVNMHWDIFGNYTHYELDNGVAFEKTEGRPFLEEDYTTLQQILLDKSSPYKDILYREITKDKILREDQAVDAISSATQLILGNSQTVAGAALTCYTLWHWANGDIVKEIREIAATQLSEDRISFFLTKNEPYQRLALEGMIEQNRYDSALFNTLLDSRVLTASGLMDLTIDYLENAPAQMYWKGIKKLFLNSSIDERVKCLHSLSNDNIQFERDQFTFLIKALETSDSLQEFDVILDMLSMKQMSDDQHTAIFKLLKRPIIFSRQVYWFLNEIELGTEQQQTLSDFEKANEDYLW